MKKLGLVPLLAFALSCSSDDLTLQDATFLMEQVKSTAQASMLVAQAIEMSSHFSSNTSAEAAALELAEFYAAEIDCAEVSVKAGVVAIEYGALKVCTYQGETYVGDHEIEFLANQKSTTRVRHTWREFQSSKIEISGTATVTYATLPSVRTVDLDVKWAHPELFQTSHSIGRYEEQRFGGKQPLGVTWSGVQSVGTTPLNATDVAMRWLDPVPESGSYELTLTTDELATTSFRRLSKADIRVRVESDGDEFFFDVISMEGAGGSGGAAGGGSGGGGAAGQAGAAGQEG